MRETLWKIGIRNQGVDQKLFRTGNSGREAAKKVREEFPDAEFHYYVEAGYVIDGQEFRDPAYAND